MGCSSSTAIGALEPTRECNIIEIIKSLCTASNKGSFGCFISKTFLTDNIISIIQNGNYDVILQYPMALYQRGGNNSRERALLGKTFKHKDIKLTPESKGAFLEAVKATDMINGFKIFGATTGRYNTFSSEILRYREMMTDPDFFTNSTTIRAVTFSPTVIATSKINSKEYEKSADFISFSIRKKGINLSRVDFILSETCTPVISKKPGTNKQTYLTSNLPAFIKTLITDLHQLHKKGIYHLDIKPDNIVYCNGRYKFIDYGLATSIPTTLAYAKDKLKGYINKKFEEFKGSQSYLNPLYRMMQIGFQQQKNIFSVDEINRLYSPVIQPGVQTFLNYYPDYKTTTTGNRFNIIPFMDRKPKSDLKEEYDFVTHFYRRADWFGLAVTIDELLTNVSRMKQSSKDKYTAGIQRLCNISNTDLENPNLDKILISEFGLRASSSRSARVTSPQ